MKVENLTNAILLLTQALSRANADAALLKAELRDLRGENNALVRELERKEQAPKTCPLCGVGVGELHRPNCPQST